MDPELTFSEGRVLDALAGGGNELEQAVRVLGAAGATSPETLPVAVGDRRLLALALALSNRRIELLAGCPRCGTMSAAFIDLGSIPPLADAAAGHPTYADLRDLPADPDAALCEFHARCGEDAALGDDSLAGPVVLACSACGQAMAVDADVERLALERLNECARARDAEVHAIASAYGWGLAEIESLSRPRRMRLAELILDR